MAFLGGSGCGSHRESLRRVQGLGSRAQDVGFRVLALRVWGSTRRVGTRETKVAGFPMSLDDY